MRGVKQQIAQVCHGKKGPLSRLSAGDGFIYYSPKISFQVSDLCKSFTAVGTVKNGTIYQVEMIPDFHPYRLDINYFPSSDVPVSELMDQLELTSQRSWGMLLRRGLIPLSKHDFLAIAQAMGAAHS